MAGRSEVEKYEKWWWMGAFLVVAVFAFGLTPWQAIGQLLEEQGVGDDQAAMIAFAAGYTLPATAGFTLAFLAVARGWLDGAEPLTRVAAFTGIFVAAAVLSDFLGLSQILTFDQRMPPGPWYVSLPLWVLTCYLNVYGWALMVSAAAIAAAVTASAQLRLPARV